jgi:hypothetical protein
MDDPVEPPEPGSGMRAANLTNLNVILHPTHVGQDKSRDSDGEYEYVSCEAWTFNEHGIDEHGTDVRFSAWRAVEQLKKHLGGYVVCKPTKHPDNSVTLEKVTDRAKQKAVELEPVVKDTVTPDDGSDPF